MGITNFMAGSGGYAEYASVTEQSSVLVPKGLSDVQAAGFPIGFRTAWTALVQRSEVHRGEWLLVLGASGSSGIAAVQLGKALGLKVIAVAGSADKRAFALAAGADAAVDHHDPEFADRVRELSGGGVDVVFDVVGGETAARALDALRRNGRHLIVGLASGTTVPLESMQLLLRNISAVGVFAGGHTPAEDLIAWQGLVDLVDNGALVPLAGTTVEFSDVPTMIRGQSAAPPGKRVVIVQGCPAPAPARSDR